MTRAGAVCGDWVACPLSRTKVFEVDPLRCPRCGGNMAVVAWITKRRRWTGSWPIVVGGGSSPLSMEPRLGRPPGRDVAPRGGELGGRAGGDGARFKCLCVGRTTTVELIAVDGQVTVRLDDRVFQRVGIGLTAPIPRATAPQQSLRLGARGGSVDIDRVRIDRAVGWLGSPRLEDERGLLVPDRSVFVVGDPGAESQRDLPVEAIVPCADLLGRVDYLLLPWARRGTVR